MSAPAGENVYIDYADGVHTISNYKAYRDVEAYEGNLRVSNCALNAISTKGEIDLDRSIVHRIDSGRNIRAEDSNISYIDARESVGLKNCLGKQVLAGGGIIASSQGPAESSFNLLSASCGVHLRGVSAGGVNSYGPANCVGGKFHKFLTKGPSALKQAHIGSLSLLAEEFSEIAVVLTDTTVDTVAIREEEASCSMIGLDVAACFFGTENGPYSLGRKLIWEENGSLLKIDEDSFSFTGEFSDKFEKAILGRCNEGTIGFINGLKKRVTANGIEPERLLITAKNTRTKVLLVGGKVLGNIYLKGNVDVDTSQVEFTGEIIRGVDKISSLPIRVTPPTP